MDIPLLGTIDFSPSGLFLFFAAVIALGYFGYQLFGSGRAGRNAKEADEAPQVEAGDGTAGDTGMDDTGMDGAGADGAGESAAQTDKDERNAD
jgi:hypothetical protein